jgi:predicted alpha/beta superfamily hydrolase
MMTPSSFASVWRGLTLVFALLAVPRADGTEAPGSRPPSFYQEQTLRSALLGEDRRILVRLPRHYTLDRTTRYPVLYKLDGDNQIERYHESIDVLNSLDAIPDVIVVAIPNARGQRNRDLTPASMHQETGPDGKTGTGEMGRGDRFLNFIEQELIPQIDNQYRTAPLRIFAGHSRGGLLVLQSLLSKPELFQARFMFSAPLMRDEQRLIVDTQRFFREHPEHRSFLYCNWGEQENEGMSQSYAAMKTLLLSKAPRGLRWTIERARAADHQLTPLIALPSALYEFFASDGRNTKSPQRNRTERLTSSR